MKSEKLGARVSQLRIDTGVTVDLGQFESMRLNIGVTLDVEVGSDSDAIFDVTLMELKDRLMTMKNEVITSRVYNHAH